jgi:membrane-associated phospholipid phosphatase
MTDAARPWLAWPGAAHLRFAAMLALVGGAWFALVYGGANAWTARRTEWWSVHLPFEPALPFVPEMIIIYVSLYSIFILAPFILRSRRELQSLAVSCNLAILVAGVGFVLIPAALAYPTLGHIRAMPELFRAADRLNLTYNLVPSLHVTFAVLLGAAVARLADANGRLLLWLWVSAIAISTLLTHQHHVVDVVTGALLGGAVYRWVYRPRVADGEIAVRGT